MSWPSTRCFRKAVGGKARSWTGGGGSALAFATRLWCDFLLPWPMSRPSWVAVPEVVTSLGQDTSPAGSEWQQDSRWNLGLFDTFPYPLTPSPVPQLAVPWPADIRQAPALPVFCRRSGTLTGVALAHLVVQQENKHGEKKKQKCSQCTRIWPRRALVSFPHLRRVGRAQDGVGDCPCIASEGHRDPREAWWAEEGLTLEGGRMNCGCYLFPWLLGWCYLAAVSLSLAQSRWGHQNPWTWPSALVKIRYAGRQNIFWEWCWQLEITWASQKYPLINDNWRELNMHIQFY